MKLADPSSRLYFLAFSVLLMTAGCKPVNKSIAGSSRAEISRLNLVGTFDLVPGLIFKGTTVGGLSGIDFDPKNDLYYLVCDDRSDINPSRFYTAKVSIDNKGIDTVQFLTVTNLADRSGRPYASIKEDPYRRADPEGIRYDAARNRLVWSNEGEKTVINGQLVRCNPTVTAIGLDGHFRDSFYLPLNMQVYETSRGVRKNGAFEGLSFDEKFKFLFVCVEEPLYEDGPRAGMGDSTAWLRFIKFDASSKRQVAQFGYKADAISYPADPPGAYKINGVSEILYVGNDKLLVVERSFSTGRRACSVRIYLADLSGATDVASVSSLAQIDAFKPASKKLLLNMDELDLYIDNVEGITFGPILPNGKRSLLLVTDDNFSPTQKTQFFLFEIVP